jgi:hypothetical protein
MSESITNAAGAGAALGALPMPVGSEPRSLDLVEDELTGVSLSLYEEELETARLRLALKSAQRGRRELRAGLQSLQLGDLDGRVSAACQDPEHPTWLRKPGDTRRCPWCRIAELESERHATNGALDDAVQELRARRREPDDVTPQVRKLRALLAGQRVQAGGE